MASVLSRMPRSAASIRPRCVMPRLAPSPITLQRRSRAGDADRVVGAVADRVVGLGRGAHIGADAAEEQQIDRRLQDRPDHLLRRRLGLGEAERRLRLRRQRDLLQRAREHAAARGDQRAVVVLPARARQIEQALPLGEALVRIGRGIDEDVAVVERGDQPDRPLPQHAVAEDVARHVADADHGERRLADIDVHLAEVALDRFPGAAGGDAHLLVVVAGRPAGGEGVVEPEVMLL